MIRGTLAFTNIYSFSTKQPGVQGPCAGSKHDEAHSERREQEVQVRAIPSRKENPDFDDCLQSSGNRHPQSGQQQNSNADRREIHPRQPQLRCVSNREAATNNQGNTRGQAENEKSSAGPAAGKHRKQSLQLFPLLRLNVTVLRGECKGIADSGESPNVGDVLDPFGWSMTNLQFDESALQSRRHGVSSVIDAELGKDAFYVALDSIFRDRQLIGNQFVGISRCD